MRARRKANKIISSPAPIEVTPASVNAELSANEATPDVTRVIGTADAAAAAVSVSDDVTNTADESVIRTSNQPHEEDEMSTTTADEGLTTTYWIPKLRYRRGATDDELDDQEFSKEELEQAMAEVEFINGDDDTIVIVVAGSKFSV